jgi:DNA-binding response OmpR family regulator
MKVVSGSDQVHGEFCGSLIVVLLDRDLPVMHGDEVCSTLVAQGSLARIVMLSAAGGVDDR